MIECALLIDGTFKEIRRYESKPADIPHKLVTWHDVSRAPRPAATVTQDPVEQWSLVNGAWAQSWTMVNVSAEEAARRQQAANDKAAAEAIKADAFVQNFVSMTPTQVEAYVDNNTATLAAVRALMKKMALMLLMLAKNEYR